MSLGCSARQRLAQGGSARTRTALSWLIACARDLVAEVLASLNSRTISTGPSPALAVAVARPDSTAWAAASASVASVLPRRRRVVLSRGVDLDHLDAGGARVAGQRRPVGAGALDPRPAQRAEPTRPSQELLVAGGGRRKQPRSCTTPRRLTTAATWISLWVSAPRTTSSLLLSGWSGWGMLGTVALLIGSGTRVADVGPGRAVRTVMVPCTA